MTKILIRFVCVLAVLLGSRPVEATTIGPDAFGYTATDEITFDFVNISATGTLAAISDCDDCFAAVPMGFTFDFYGVSYTTVFISTNGLLTFGSGTTDFNNTDLTLNGAPTQPAIAALWDDFTNVDQGELYYQTSGAPGSQQFIVQWNNVEQIFDFGPTMTFEAILYEGSNNILFSYLDVVGGPAVSNGAFATVGIRDAGGQPIGEVLQWSFNSAQIRDGQDILFSTQTGTPSAVPEPTSLLLLGTGLAGIAARRYRQRKARQ